MSQRSSLERLPQEVLDAVDAAIAEGATNDEIVTLVGVHGGDCSRSAAGRYARRTRNLIGLRREAARIGATRVRTGGERGEEQPPDHQLAIESLRSLALLSAADLGKKGRAVAPQDVSRLALALRRIEDADRHRAENARAARAEVAAAAPGGLAVQKGGLSDDAVAILRRAIEGELFPSRAAGRQSDLPTDQPALDRNSPE